ncbi:MAG: hypothetical protein IPL55_00160 [Saprospiraceae bacterium]|nr:hypothetical protein [Saprospiraceae bacterium]
MTKKKSVIDQPFLLKHVLPLLLTKGKIYQKTGQVQATKAKGGEVIASITSSGFETTKTANKGDYILTNLHSKAKERYIISPEKFITRYKKISTISRGVGLYSPTGKVRAITLTKSLLDTMKWKDQFYILAPWGENQYVEKGDYLVCPLTEDEVYRIGKKEFKETYKRMA